MFTGNWHRFAAPWIAFAVLVLGVSFWFVWDLSAEQTEQRIRGEQTTDRHIQYAEDRIDENCLALQGVALRDCIHQEIEAARDHSRSEQDLDAQQTMAFFTKIMGATAVLGIVLGLGSVALIYMTLTETQRMANDTREIGEAQAKSYVGVSSAEIKLVGHSHRKLAYNRHEYFQAILYTSNKGATPCLWYEVSGRSVLRKTDGGAEVSSFDAEVRQWGGIDPGGELTSPFQTSDSASQIIECAMSSDQLYFSVEGQIRSMSVFGKIDSTRFSFFVKSDQFNRIFSGGIGSLDDRKKPIRMIRPTYEEEQRD